MMENKELKYLTGLNRVKNRYESGYFFVEGKRLVESAISYNANIKNIYATESFLEENNSLKDLIEKKNYTINTILRKQLEKISFTKNPSGIGALCKISEYSLDSSKNNKWLYLDEISDPGNLGTLLRSAAYFNFTNIALSKNCVDPYNPKVVRSAMGAHFKIELYLKVELNNFQNNYCVFGADQNGDNYKNIQYPKNLILVLGNEAHGLSKKTVASLDNIISIKKTGFGESLNVGSAGSIIMSHLSEI